MMLPILCRVIRVIRHMLIFSYYYNTICKWLILKKNSAQWSAHDTIITKWIFENK